VATSINDLLSYRLAVLASLNDRSGHAHLKEAFGLTLSEWRVLGNIAARARASFSDIADAMLIDKGQLSRTVAALAGRGLIVSVVTPADRRGTTLEMTAAGRRFHSRVLAFAMERNEALLSCLDTRERHQLDAMLRKLMLFVEIEQAGLARGNARDAETAARKATAVRKLA
jgi:DNA-binding MarR family transcriptional regulator